MRRVLLVLAVIGLAGEARASDSVAHYFLGNEPARWKTVREPAPAALSSRAGDWRTPLLIPALLNAIPYSVVVGGNRNLGFVRIAVDSQGNVYVAGGISYSDPALPGTSLGDVFLVKLDRSGNVIYTTYFGGDGSETVEDIAVDAAGRVYLVGSTSSPNFPAINAIQAHPLGGSDAFVVRLGPNGGFQYSTCLGGKGEDYAMAVAVDAAGSAYITGWTESSDFPLTPGAFQTELPPSNGFNRPTSAFVSKLSPDGTRLVYSTLLGGTKVYCNAGSSCIPAGPGASGRAIAVDEGGNAYVAGSTNSYDFPVTPGALQPWCACSFFNNGAFLTKLNPAGSAPVFSTFFGGASERDLTAAAVITRLTVVPSGSVFLTGYATTSQFPTTPGVFRPSPDPQFRFSGSPFAFVARLNPGGTALQYSTLLSGERSEKGTAIQVDPQGNAYVTGTTQAADFPVTTGAFSRGGDFFVELNNAGSALLYSTLLPSGSAGVDVRVDSAGNIYLLGDTGYVSRIGGGSHRLPAILGVSNAASTRVTPRIAPGELISIFGADIGPENPTGLELAPSGKVTTALAGTQLLVDGMPAPLTFAQKDQINAVVPFGIRWDHPYPTLRVIHNGEPAGEIRLFAAAVDPDVFRAPGDWAAFNMFAPAAALNEDGSLNSERNPAGLGSIVSVFATGLGTVDPPVEDGAVTFDPLPKPKAPVSVESSPSGQSLEVLYAGQAPGLVAGVMQINFRLPPSLVNSNTALGIKVGGLSSPTFTVFVTP